MEAGYVHGRDYGGMDQIYDWWDLSLCERGRRTVGQWPSDDPGHALVQLLEERIAVSDDAVERSRLSKVHETVQTVGTSVVSGVLRDLIRANTGT